MIHSLKLIFKVSTVYSFGFKSSWVELDRNGEVKYTNPVLPGTPTILTKFPIKKEDFKSELKTSGKWELLLKNTYFLSDKWT